MNVSLPDSYKIISTKKLIILLSLAICDTYTIMHKNCGFLYSYVNKKYFFFPKFRSNSQKMNYLYKASTKLGETHKKLTRIVDKLWAFVNFFLTGVESS